MGTKETGTGSNRGRDSEVCESCKHWDSDGPITGECKAHAPRPTAAGGVSADDFSAWPTTRPGEWCGEFERHVDAEDASPLADDQHKLTHDEQCDVLRGRLDRCSLTRDQLLDVDLLEELVSQGLTHGLTSLVSNEVALAARGAYTAAGEQDAPAASEWNLDDQCDILFGRMMRDAKRIKRDALSGFMASDFYPQTMLDSARGLGLSGEQFGMVAATVRKLILDLGDNF